MNAYTRILTAGALSLFAGATFAQSGVSGTGSGVAGPNIDFFAGPSTAPGGNPNVGDARGGKSRGMGGLTDAIDRAFTPPASQRQDRDEDKN
jgi:hypothetical protein